MHAPTKTPRLRLNNASCMHIRSTNHIHQHPRQHPRQPTRCQATNTDVPPQYTEGSSARPPWAGGGLLSDLANIAINTPPIYAVLTRAAKFVLKRGAQKQGIDWDGIVEGLQHEDNITQRFDALQDPTITYPDYYLCPFHAYPQGNLEWLAAYEAQPATLSVAMRAWRDPTITPTEAHTRLRNCIHHMLQEYMKTHNVGTVNNVLDIGCGVGMSTRALADAFPQASTTGLDLSAYFLAVAEHTSQQYNNVKYVHAAAEAMPFPPASFDIVSLQYIFHECPPEAINAILAEAMRVLRPGGVVLVVDTDPKSAVLQKLPPAIATLQKATEPYSDQYFVFDVEGAMAQQGLRDVRTAPCSSRHRCMLGVFSG